MSVEGPLLLIFLALGLISILLAGNPEVAFARPRVSVADSRCRLAGRAIMHGCQSSLIRCGRIGPCDGKGTTSHSNQSWLVEASVRRGWGTTAAIGRECWLDCSAWCGTALPWDHSET
jgi:hypothetical protein